MDVTRALHLAVKHFHLGSESLAAAMGLRDRKTLLEKVNPNRADMHASPEEVVQIMEITKDYGALHAMAGLLDHTCIKNPSSGALKGPEAAKAIADTMAKTAEFVQKALAADADGDVSGNEDADCAAACMQLIQAANAARAYIAWRHEQCKPAHLRAASQELDA